MKQRARLAAEATIQQLTPEYLKSLPFETRRKVRNVLRALCIIVAHDRNEEDVWDALEVLNKAVDHLETNQAI